MRPNTIKVPSPDVQGEGSFIKWKRLTWGERAELFKEWIAMDGGGDQTKMAQDRFQFIQTLMLSQLVGWNWTDTEGAPLPMPERLEDFDDLYPEETDFLYGVAERAIRGRLAISEADLKN